MNINTNSWHFKMIDGFCDTVPKSLCPYIRKLSFVLLICLAVILMFGFMFSALGSSFLSSPLVGWVSTSVLFWISSFFTGLVVFSLAVGIVVGVVGLFILIKSLIHKRKKAKEQKRIEAGIPEKPKSIVAAWVEAKHDKICPTLTFTDGE